MAQIKKFKCFLKLPDGKQKQGIEVWIFYSTTKYKPNPYIPVCHNIQKCNKDSSVCRQAQTLQTKWGDISTSFAIQHNVLKFLIQQDFG